MRSGVRHFNYVQSEAFLDSKVRWFWALSLVLALVMIPVLGDSYLVFMVGLIGINIISTAGLNILTGFTGQLSVGHAAFMGIGAYAAALTFEHTGTGMVGALIAAMVVAGCFGIAVGLPSLKIKGLYLAITTMAAQFIATFVFREWSSVTGGDAGMSISAPSLFGFSFASDYAMYLVIMPLTLGTVLFAQNLMRTRVGRAFIAVRERDYSAEVIGVHLLKTKLTAFALSAIFAGLAGGLMVFFYRIAAPEQFAFNQSIFFLSAIIVGGLGRTLGTVLGAAFMTLVPEILGVLVPVLSGLDATAAAALSAPVNEIVFGTLIVLFLIFEPLGLAEVWARLRRYFINWPFSV